MLLDLTLLCERFGGQLINGGCQFFSVSTDTRTLQPGDVFVALRGPSFDGHEFCRKAADMGATALVTQDVVAESELPQWIVKDSYEALGRIAQMWREQFVGRVAAITGSAGKTSVKGMLAKILGDAAPTLATAGNLNNQVGVPLTLMQLDSRHQYAVIEAGASRPGDIKWLAELIQPDVSVVTNIMPAHVEGFGSVAAIAKEKAELYRGLKSDGIAIVNADSAHRSVLEEACGDKQKVFVTTEAPTPDSAECLIARNVSLTGAGCAHFDLIVSDTAYPVQLNVLGAHNVSNALCALACANALGIELDTAVESLEGWRGESGRMQLVENTLHGACVIDDTYNANPGSVKAAIDWLATYPHTLLVLGDMGEQGDETESAHTSVGQYAAEAGIDSLMATGPNSQLTCTAFGENGSWFEEKSQLIDAVRSRLQADTVVLIKGSRSAGMEAVVAALRETGEQQ